MKIAICLYGITRSLTHTHRSIEARVIAPARKIGQVKTFAHFFEIDRLLAPQQYEAHKPESDEHTLLPIDHLAREPEGDFLAGWDYETLKSYGDYWTDGFRSLHNHMHMIYSMRKAYLAAAEWQPDIYVFLRPDLLYRNSFATVLRKATYRQDQIFLPNWQHYNGYNDRFAVATGKAADAYGRRIESALDYCAALGALHAESHLKYVLDQADVQPKFVLLYANRVRAGGAMKREIFVGPRLHGLLRPYKHVPMMIATALRPGQTIEAPEAALTPENKP